MIPRIALIGARRANQGLGPFVARFLEAAGAEVVGFLGTSEASNTQAARELYGELGRVLPGFTDVDTMLSACQPHALAILCPPEQHERYLTHALDRGLHAFCEKPLVVEGLDAWSGVPRLLEGFERRGLYLAENCQWPFVLPVFWSLFPYAKGLSPDRFAMGLAPSSSGVRMAVDSLSHPLSLLQALLPGPAEISDIHVLGESSPGPRTIEFRWTGLGPPVECRIELEDSPLRPRPAWFQVGSHRADRRIRASDYAMFLESPSQMLPVPDPLGQHVAQFVHTLRAVLNGAAPPSLTPLRRRARLLHELLGAFPPSDL